MTDAAETLQQTVTVYYPQSHHLTQRYINSNLQKGVFHHD